MTFDRDDIGAKDYPDYPHHYDRLIIIDFMSDGKSAKAIQKKWDDHHKNNNTCTHVGTDKTFSQVDFHRDKLNIQINDNESIKIYILAHSSPGAPLFGEELDPIKNSKKKFKINTDELAKKLVDLIGNNKAVVNLIACGAAIGKTDSLLGDKGNDSCAANLHQSMYLISNRDIPVVARRQKLSVSTHTGTKKTISLKYTYKQSIAKNKQSKQHGSKVIFMMDAEGDQIKLDSYSHDWKEKVMAAINKLLDDSTVFNKDLLIEWNNNFDKMSPFEIYNVMSEEIDVVLTLFNQDLLGMFYGDLNMNPKSYNVVIELLRDGKKIFASEYTSQKPEKTGRSFGKK